MGYFIVYAVVMHKIKHWLVDVNVQNVQYGTSFSLSLTLKQQKTLVFTVFNAVFTKNTHKRKFV